MTGDKVEHCIELTRGDWIHARQGETDQFEGMVTETHPGLALFWAVSETGVRRLIDFEDWTVRRA